MKKYEFFAERARQENYLTAALLFKAASFAESIHIKNHLRALKVIEQNDNLSTDFVNINLQEIKDSVSNTRDNLLNAISGEIYETKKMYRDFVKNAKKEKNDMVELTFTLARKAEKVHAKLFSNALKTIDDNSKSIGENIYVCKICGNIEFNSPPEICPICDHSKDFYEQIIEK